MIVILVIMLYSGIWAFLGWNFEQLICRHDCEHEFESYETIKSKGMFSKGKTLTYRVLVCQKCSKKIKCK